MANSFFKIKQGLNLANYPNEAALSSITNPQVGDLVTVGSGAVYTYNGSNWVDVGSSGSVVSVNGQTGVVSLDTADIPEDSNLYFTDGRAQTAAVVNSSAGSETTQAMSVSAGKSYTDSAVSSEASARSAADTTLQNNINAEESARIAADTTLQNNINAEESARIAADALLIPLSQKGAPNGVATLDGSGLIPTSQIPFSAAPVTSVNGETGAVSLNSGEIPESGNLYFTDGRAQSAAVVNSTSGSETVQAPSVSAVKAYVAASSPVLSVNSLTGNVSLDTGNVPEGSGASASWSSSGAMNTPRKDLAGVGTQDAALAIGGSSSGSLAVTTTELFNGSSWSATTALVVAQAQLAGAGNQSAAAVFGGYNSGGIPQTRTQLFNGSTWVSNGNLLTARYGLAGAGIQSAALAFGGNPGSSYSVITEKFNGSTWSSTGNMITGRTDLAGAGIQSAALAFGGDAGSASAVTEKFDGSSWSLSGNLTSARYGLAGAGTQSAAIAFGGFSTGYSAVTETFNGSTWSTTSPMGTARVDLAAAGIQSAAVAFGGYNNNVIGTTEKYTGTTAPVLYFTDARAQSAAVVNSTSGNETDQAPSVAAVKSYVAASSPVLSVNGETGTVSLNSGEIPESGNLYFTDARAQTAAVVNSTAGSETNQAASVQAMKNYVASQPVGGVQSVNGETGVVSLDSGEIPEGSNLYFTDARAQTAAVVNSSAGSETTQAMSVLAAKSYTDSAVSSEASARSAADTTLQNNINAEESARIAADNTLQNNINAEESARIAADALLIPLTQKGVASGVATLDVTGKVPASQIPPVAITSVTVVATIAERDALTPGEGDFCVVTDVNETFIYNGTGWIELLETSGVVSVNGQTGAVSLSTTDISEGSNLYFTDGRAQTAAVVNSSSGSETTQAMSVSAAKSYTDSAVAAEAALRSAADTTLQNNINAEESARIAADALLIPLSQKGVANGVATLDGSGLIPTSQIPFSAAPVTSVNGEIGDVVLDTDDVSEGAINKYFSDALAQTAAVINSTAGSETNQAASVQAMKNYVAASSPVLSVNGETGTVSLDSGEIPEGSNLYFTDGRAQTAAVVNSSAGSETTQAASVQAMKDYVAASSPVLSVNGESGTVSLDSGEIPEGSNLYFTDGRAQTAAVVDSMAGSQTNQAPSVSSVKGAIQFRPEYSRYVAYNGSDSTGNGSQAAPYRTIQAAMDSLPAPVAGANIEDCVIYIYPGVYNEALSWTRSNTHLVGLQAPRKNIQAVSIKGGIDFNIAIAEPGGMFANISSVSNILIASVSGGTRNVINYNGSNQVVLQLVNSQVYQDSVGYSAISMNNTASSLSRLYLDNTVVQCVGTGAGHALDLIKGNLFSAFNSEIYRLYSTDVSARAIKLSNNSTVANISNGQVIADKDYVIEMAGTGNFTAALTLIQNSTSNKSGILIAAGTVCTVLNCSFNIPAGTGKAIDGSAGAVLYYASNIYLANTSVASAITKLQAATDTTTSVITEGSNQYFTTARARTAAVVNSTAGSETDQAPSVAAVKSYISASAPVLSVNGETGAVSLDSGEIPEGSNLYFTDARAQTAAVVNDATGSQTTQAPSVSSIKNYVDSSVSTEASARSAADTTLQNNINAEESARIAADNTLQGNINAEESARIAADALLIPLTQKGAANGVATLDGTGKIPSSQIPPVAITSVTVVATIAERDALTPGEGDFCVVTDVNETFIYNGTGWIELLETSGVVSVNGQTGAVSLSTTDISEGSNLYFTDGRAQTAAVVNSSSGSETTQAMSVSAAKSYTDSAVAAEAALRSAADTTLQNNINAEESARIAADALLIPLTQKAATNGVATLDGSGKVPVTQIPFDQSPVTSVNGETGDVSLNSGEIPESGNLYFTDGRAQTAAVVNSSAGNETTQAASVSAMKSYVANSSPVLSVNGESGTVSLNSGEIPEGSNLYFTDTRAKTAAVVNSSAGSQTDQAMSVSAAKSYTDSAVAAEAALRSAADTTLQNNINAEESARIAADTTLQNNINAEESARIAADALLIPLTQKGANSGVATLDVNGKIPSSQLPAIAITSVTVVATIAERDALTPQEGDFCVVTDVGETFVYNGSAWIEMVETSGVVSVNGQSGVVSISTTDISEGSNLYFTDGRAQTAAVVNSSAGSETVQAMSVSAAKSFTTSAVASEAAARAAGDALLIPLSQKAAPSGVATLDINGLVPVTQLPATTAPVTSVNGEIGDVILTTTEVTEGSNLYFTNTRARTAAVLNTTAGNEINQAASVSAMKAYVAASAPVLSVNDLTGAVVLTTTEVTEGTNLYFTNTRARTAAVLNTTAGSETTQAPSVSAMKAYVAANTISGVVRYGTSPMANGVSTFTVSFSDIGSTSYVVTLDISNTVDGTPRHLSCVVTAKTSSSFSFTTPQTTDSANYVANYYIIKL
jgi:hypothetical protein